MGGTEMTYEDSRGWKFKVMPGLGDNTYKARYKKPNYIGWHCVANLPWRNNPEDAEQDLAEYARRKKMKAVE